MQLQEKQAKNIENQLSLCSKRMWCRKKKKGRKSAENFPLSWKKKNMEDMMMMWNLMLWNAPFSTKSPLAQVWILCCFSSCYCVGFLLEQEQRMDGLDFFPTFYQLYLGVIWGIHIWPSKREMVDRSTNKRKQQKKQQRNKRLKRQTNRQTDVYVVCVRGSCYCCVFFLYCCFLFLPSYFCFPISQFTDVCMDGCVCVCVCGIVLLPVFVQ